MPVLFDIAEKKTKKIHGGVYAMKKAIKRIVALGTGATMLGATILGAVATADLANYPAPFIEGGMYNAIAVVGDDSSAEDSIGVSDVLVGLQGQASTTTATTQIDGDAYKIAKSSNELNLNEQLSSILSAVTKDELNALADGSVVNSQGTFTYNQYVELPDAQVVYDVDTYQSDDPALYLKFADGANAYKYKLTFPTALESDIDDTTLSDLVDKKITMLGKEFTIIDADNSTGAIEMMAGAVQDVLTEEESKTYTVDGIDYNVEVLTITSVAPLKVKFMVNGETTTSIEAGETARLGDGTEIGVREILPNKAGYLDMVELYLGAEKVTLKDEGFDGSGSLEVGTDTISDVTVEISGSTSAATISKIEVYWEAAEDYFVPVGSKLSDELESDYKDNLFLRNLDFEFIDVDFGSTEEVRLDGGSDEMKLRVPTRTGGDLDFYAFYYNGSNMTLGRNADRALITSDSASENITRNDQFILNTDVYSHLMEVSRIDSDKVTFRNVGTGQTFEVSTSSSAGEFYLDGYQYVFSVHGTDSITMDNGLNNTIYTPSESYVTVSTDGINGTVTFTEEDTTYGETITIDVIYDSSEIQCDTPSSATGLTLKSWDSKDNYEDGYTAWGTHVAQDTDQDDNPVTITYPVEQAIADVYIASGVITTTPGGETPGETIDVGSAMLDIEVADWKAQNVIVVGGPCVNRVAAGLMGFEYPSNECADGFEEGKAWIKLFEGLEGQEDNVALLIAGYSSADTRRACTVMGNYKDYADDLEGKMVEMTATSDTDISLSVPEIE